MSREPIELYVDQSRGDASGNARADGTASAPFRSLAMALNTVRAWRKNGNTRPLCIRLMGAAYYLEDTLELDASLGALTLESAGEKPCLVSAGRWITGFQPTVFRGVPCVVADLPEVPGGWHFNDLYVNGHRANITRYPAEGFLTPEAVENPSTDLRAVSRWFIAKPGDLDGVTVTPTTELGYCHLWVDEHTPIDEYDPATRKVTMRYYSRHTVAGGSWAASAMEYWLENLPECFTSPGQWYLDAPENKLYYIPRPEEDAENLVAVVPVLRHAAIVSGRGIVLRHLTFSHTSGEYVSRDDHTVAPGGIPMASDCQSVCCGYGLLEFRGAKDCRVEDCTFTEYGVHGIAVQDGSHRLTVARCRFTEGGAGGITVTGGTGDDPASHTHTVCIEDNLIDGMGRRYTAGCGILLRHTYGNVIAHNEICNVLYTGISVGWVWGYGDSVCRDNRIEYNHIHHIGNGALSDMGGIYLLGRQPGTVVRGNHIHHVCSRHYGGWGLYADEGSSEQTYEDNLIYGCSSSAFNIHYGKHNVLRNNILIGGKERAVSSTRAEGHRGVSVYRNIIVAVGTPLYEQPKDEADTPMVTGEENLLFDATGRAPVYRTEDGTDVLLTDAMTAGKEPGSIVADPGFADPEHGDYTLKADSPAVSLGFQPFDWRKAGRRV